MRCPVTSLQCPQNPCPGLDNPEVCNKVKEALPPTVVTKAINLGVAVVKHLADGLAKVDDDYYEQRLKICKSCEHRSLDDNNPECLICGCPVKTKAHWRSEGCPIGKWQSHPAEKPSSVLSEASANDQATLTPATATNAQKDSGGGCGCGK